MYKIGICDDDMILCSALEEQLLAICVDLGLKAETEVWYSGEGLLSDLEKGVRLDLIFLDIELVRRDGVSVGAYIRNEMEDIQTHIVYISSKQSYAMQLFKVQPLDFLIKPVSEEQLKEVLVRSIRQKRNTDLYFVYEKGGSVFRVPVEEILYFMSMDKKLVIVKRDGREEFYGRLKDIAGRLPEIFMMVHQSYIINQSFVSVYSYEEVRMANSETIPISRPYRKEIRSKIKRLRKAEMDYEP